MMKKITSTPTGKIEGAAKEPLMAKKRNVHTAPQRMGMRLSQRSFL